MSDNDEFDYLKKQILDQRIADIEFEASFYTEIAGTAEVEIIPIPCLDGSILDDEEKLAIAATAELSDKKLLYRISHGDIAVVFTKNGDKIGIQPEFNIHGFPC